MTNLSRLLLVLLFALLIGGAAFLVTWDIPAPVSDVQKVIPDARFPR